MAHRVRVRRNPDTWMDAETARRWAVSADRDWRAASLAAAEKWRAHLPYLLSDRPASLRRFWADADRVDYASVMRAAVVLSGAEDVDTWYSEAAQTDVPGDDTGDEVLGTFTIDGRGVTMAPGEYAAHVRRTAMAVRPYYETVSRLYGAPTYAAVYRPKTAAVLMAPAHGRPRLKEVGEAFVLDAAIARLRNNKFVGLGEGVEEFVRTIAVSDVEPVDVGWQDFLDSTPAKITREIDRVARRFPGRVPPAPPWPRAGADPRAEYAAVYGDVPLTPDDEDCWYRTVIKRLRALPADELPPRAEVEEVCRHCKIRGAERATVFAAYDALAARKARR